MSTVRAQIKASRMEARWIAGEALGKSLPPRACVHHIDGNPLNNASSNLIVCEDNAYHRLLHRRERALKACGHANWRLCNYCKEYDNPNNLIVHQRGAHHKVCMTKYSRKYGKEYYKNGEKGKKTLKLEAVINQLRIYVRNDKN